MLDKIIKLEDGKLGKIVGELWPRQLNQPADKVFPDLIAVEDQTTGVIEFYDPELLK